MNRFLALVLLAGLWVALPADAAPARSLDVTQATASLQLREKDAQLVVESRVRNPSGVRRDGAKLTATLVARSGKRTVAFTKPAPDLPANRTTPAEVQGRLPDVVAGRYRIEVCVSDPAGRDCRLTPVLKVAGPKLQVDASSADLGVLGNGEIGFGRVVVRNTGVGAVRVSSPVQSGDKKFGIDSYGCARPLGRGDYCYVYFDFRATKIGSYSGRVTMRASTGRRISVPLKARVEEGPGELTLTPSSYDFGTVQADSEWPVVDMTVTNVGEGSTYVTGTSVLSAFDVDFFDCDQLLAPGDSCTIQVFARTDDDPGSYEGYVAVKHWRGATQADLSVVLE